MTVTHPAIPAVYETVTIPATTDVVWAVESPGEGYAQTDERWVETKAAVPAKDEVPEVTDTETAWFETDPGGDWEFTGESRTVIDQEAVAEQWVFEHVVTGNLRYEDSPKWNSEDNQNSTGWVLIEHIEGSPELSHEESEFTRTFVVQEYEPARDAVEAEGYTEYEWTKRVPETTVTRELSPAVAERTEQVLVSDAVPAGPPCEESPVVTPGESEEPVVAPVEEEKPTPAKPTNPGKPAPSVDAEEDQVGGVDADRPKPRPQPVVAGQPEALPTAVDAGLAPVAAASTSSPLGQGLLAGGLVMLVLAGALQTGRRERGTHEI